MEIINRSGLVNQYIFLVKYFFFGTILVKYLNTRFLLRAYRLRHTCRVVLPLGAAGSDLYYWECSRENRGVYASLGFKLSHLFFPPTRSDQYVATTQLCFCQPYKITQTKLTIDLDFPTFADSRVRGE